MSSIFYILRSEDNQKCYWSAGILQGSRRKTQAPKATAHRSIEKERFAHSKMTDDKSVIIRV